MEFKASLRRRNEQTPMATNDKQTTQTIAQKTSTHKKKKASINWKEPIPKIV